jgi:hypothetical protein
MPGGAALDQSGARGHDPDEEPVRDMITKKDKKQEFADIQWLIIIR